MVIIIINLLMKTKVLSKDFKLAKEINKIKVLRTVMVIIIIKLLKKNKVLVLILMI
ncbi:hypothetical protein HMPREF9726_00581 [Treponema denticola H-22]|uniref:Uncharacterized protein n=1 Tax=Treponema denticola H-22 TaxID=999432 RepID=A0A0E2E6M8_TREDN|nr:hypothetical protein HMPREF9726_00581 [Treponema denticola H-22]